MQPISARAPPTDPEHEQALRSVGLPVTDGMGFFAVVEEIYEILGQSEKLDLPIPVDALKRGNQPRMSPRTGDAIIHKFLLHVLSDKQSALRNRAIYRIRQLYGRLQVILGVQAASSCVAQLVRDSCEFIVHMKSWAPHLWPPHFSPLPGIRNNTQASSSEDALKVE